MLACRLVVVVLVALVVAGCALFHPWPTPRPFDGSYDQVFQATLETLKARDFPIECVDREEGRIETGKRPVDAIDSYRPVETVRAYAGRKGQGKASMRLFMTFLESRPDPSATPGRGSVANQGTAVTGDALKESAIYDDYLDAIGARVSGGNGQNPIANSRSSE